MKLLVEMDKANEDACGPAIAHLLQHAYRDYGDDRYERLATLSVCPASLAGQTACCATRLPGALRA